ncbi:hypothetical protein GIB67_019490 [Kingdonia uniflora]|uniref:VOC domain-containing protein n=1 Tax=Kingdonia uniflora TaxID=39325 RepID=A0A7J7N0K0_9MAGN|nr:hypothetical protein GIB67_019490 [Kingdonia uniflora]
MGIMKDVKPCLPLLSLNHISFVCKSVVESAKFYTDVLGFVLIKRPSSFKFEGAWLFNYGIGIHLLQASPTTVLGEKPLDINPKDNHISFQSTNIEVVKQRLEDMKMKYVTALVEEGGIQVDQLFFHDPDGYMIEICNCDNLPVLPLSACPIKKSTSHLDINNKSMSRQSLTGAKALHTAEMETRMMERFTMDMINITI